MLRVSSLLPDIFAMIGRLICDVVVVTLFVTWTYSLELSLVPVAIAVIISYDRFLLQTDQSIRFWGKTLSTYVMFVSNDIWCNERDVVTNRFPGLLYIVTYQGRRSRAGHQTHTSPSYRQLCIDPPHQMTAWCLYAIASAGAPSCSWQNSPGRPQFVFNSQIYS